MISKGKIFAVIAFIGGCLIVRSLMSTTPNTYLLYSGIFVFLVAIVLFFREITKI
jgi:hypothetical protein